MNNGNNEQEVSCSDGPGRLHVRVVEAKVRAADSNGLSDPYCVVKLKHIKSDENAKDIEDEIIGTTRVVWENREPIWNEDFLLNIDDIGELERQQVVLECYDKDMVGKDDFLGQHIFDLRLLPLNGRDLNSQCGWFPLLESSESIGKNERPSGSIYAVVVVVDSTHLWKHHPDMESFDAYEAELFHAAMKKKDTRRQSGDNWKVMVTTWNMGDATPPADLNPWIGSDWMATKLETQQKQQHDTPEEMIVFPEDYDNVLKTAKKMIQQIEVKDRKHFFSSYNESFCGADAIKWIRKNCPTIQDVGTYASKMVAYNIVDNFKGNIENAGMIDADDEYYRFVGRTRRPRVDVPITPEGLAIFYDVLFHKLEIKSRTYHFRTYERCFLASQAVECLLKHKVVLNRRHARTIANQLLQHYMIRPILFTNTKEFVEDDSFYRLYDHEDMSKEEFTMMKLQRHTNSNDYDMIVVGVQECSMSLSGLRDQILLLVGRGYTALPSKELGSMRLLCFVRKEHLQHIRNVECDTIGVGIGGVGHNKGAVAIILEAYHSRIGFVSSHLAAHQDMCNRRNRDFYHIVDGIHVGRRGLDILSQCEHIVWCGDLNYRLDFDGHGVDRTPSSEVWKAMEKLVNDGMYSKLLEYDQLRKAQANYQAFVGFCEGHIYHPPTFKVIPHKHIIEYQTKRSPAYTDRILWKSLDGYRHSLIQTGLACVEEMDSSDHKPVRSEFILHLKTLPPAFTDEIGECTLSFTALLVTGIQDHDVNWEEDTEKDAEILQSSSKFLPEHRDNLKLEVHSPIFEKTVIIDQWLNPRKQQQQQGVSTTTTTATATTDLAAPNNDEDMIENSFNEDDDIPFVDVPETALRVNRKERLRQCVIIFNLPRLGTGTLMFNRVMGNKDREYRPIIREAFSTQLYRGGIPVGELMGELTLKWMEGKGVSTKIDRGESNGAKESIWKKGKRLFNRLKIARKSKRKASVEYSPQSRRSRSTSRTSTKTLTRTPSLKMQPPPLPDRPRAKSTPSSSSPPPLPPSPRPRSSSKDAPKFGGRAQCAQCETCIIQ